MSDDKNSTAAPDTGHVWDGNLRELTNQPPRWWMITLYLSGFFIDWHSGFFQSLLKNL